MSDILIGNEGSVLLKARPHKYIKRTPKKSGKGFDYEYADKKQDKKNKITESGQKKSYLIKEEGKTPISTRMKRQNKLI